MPVLFISHGSPLSAIEEDGYADALRRLGKALPRPKAIAVLSAHWEAASPIRITASPAPGVIHDFGGFPEELYALSYPSPGDPALASEIARLLGEAGLQARLDERRPLDHGAWIPLRRMVPDAKIPVVQVTLPLPRDPKGLIRMGKALAPLRERGVLLLGSGGVVHNLGLVHFEDKEAPLDPWAQPFEDWVMDRVRRLDAAGLASYRQHAPNARLAVPSTEHFDPIFFTLGAAGDGDRFTDVHSGFQYGNLSMRCFSLGSL